MPTSPVASCPELTVIEETYATIRERLPTADVLIMCDGVRDEQAHRRRPYREYLRRLVGRCGRDWPNTLPVIFSEFTHQATMTARTLPLVRTPLVLFVEHDTPLHGDIPFPALAGPVVDGKVDVVRLYHEGRMPDEHRYLMLGRAQQVDGVPLQATVQWSQRPHLARADWYRQLLAAYFAENALTMIEDVLHGVVQTRYRAYGRDGLTGEVDGAPPMRLAIYLPDGDTRRSGHIDGRAGEPKYPMSFAYPAGQPRGAPAPTPARPTPQPAAFYAAGSGVRLGLLVRDDNRGLGNQTWELYRHLRPAKTLLVQPARWELSPYVGHPERFPDATAVRWFSGDRWSQHDVAGHGLDMTTPDLRAWLYDLDVVLTAETVYDLRLYEQAREMGVKTACIPNWELFRHHIDRYLPQPDLWVAPTSWHADELPGEHVILPLGVDRDRLPFRERDRAATLLHVIGHPASLDRQGTKTFEASLLYLEESARVVFRGQREGGQARLRHPLGPHLDVRLEFRDIENYWDLYADGDILVAPRRYGGQSLPLVEALSTGMVALMPDCAPQNELLPAGMLLPCTSTSSHHFQSGDLPLYDVAPEVLAGRLDELLRDPDEFTALSGEADRIADRLSWPRLLPDYHRVLAELAGRP